jgi:hypothetical protein
MKLSAKAARFVSQAVAGLPDASARDAWNSRLPAVGSDLSPDLAGIALRALGAAEDELVRRLAQGGLEPDLQAELGNDLQFVRSVEAELRRSGASIRAAE